MDKKIYIAILGLTIIAMIFPVDVVKANIKVSIEVKDSDGNIIVDNQTVPINTVVYVYGYYEDKDGDAPASALMEVYYKVGSNWVYEATLYDGIVEDGETIMGDPYTLSKVGLYQFRWTCTKGGPGTSTPICCVQERAQARTRIELLIPEPGTLAAGVIIAVSILAFLAIRKKKGVKPTY